MTPTDLLYFKSAAAFRRWLAQHHATATAQWVALAKKGATDRLLHYPDALDAALAYGWIDGFVSKLDDTHYALRFTPRKPRSNWSAVNVKRYEELLAQRLIEDAGRRAFDTRDRAVSEQTRAELDGELLAAFKRNKAAWAFFCAQPPGYRRQASWAVLSARTEPTRQRRLQGLIDASARGERIGQPAAKSAAKGATVNRPRKLQAKAAPGKRASRAASAAARRRPRQSA
jgi:uncharacterized protein YdeI (YjbR/CyaY-like superfamily)